MSVERLDKRLRLHCGDCLDVLAELQLNSIDACVTDPPYGLGFMGKAWDHGVPGQPYWDGVLRHGRAGRGGTKGEDHHKAKLTEADVRKARAMYTGCRGELTQLASIFGVHRSTISDAVNGDGWGCVR